jgi:sigma-B regulation protein RsbU (phosphoserine phosphatase)
VFATAYERFALEAFQYDAADYLLKPVNRQRLASTVNRLRAKVQVRRDDEREAEAAARAQAHLLPRRLPAIDGYALAARTLPARTVGGDFYDAAIVGDRIAFVLGDVAGKGMAAGLIASSVHARWQAALRQADRDVPAMMHALNRDVLASTEGSRYATLVHGVLTPETGAVEFVNAGHPAAVRVGPDGSWDSCLAATAPAVGLIDGADYAAGACTLAPGDTLLLMSDGVSEALNAAGAEFDLAELAALTAMAGNDADRLAAAVIETVRAHRGRDQAQDDVTVFVIRRSV